MQLFNFMIDKRTGIGAEFNGERIDFSRAWAIWRTLDNNTVYPPLNSIDAMLARGLFTKSAIDQVLQTIEGCSPEVRTSLKLGGDWKWATPVLKPGKIVALVQNYRKHAEEFGNQAPDKLVFFAKFPSTMIPQGGEIVFPGWLNSRVDHEVELGVVIGKTCQNVGADTALDYVGGYTILNDVSARHTQKELRDASMPWMPSKNVDTFCPVGPYLVPHDTVDNAQCLRIACKVNGTMRQEGNTEDMLHPIPKIISDLSRSLTLEPGDIIATGTPEGVSKISIGDNVECEIDGLGVLQSKVVAAR